MKKAILFGASGFAGKRYRGMDGKDVAKAMNNAAKNQPQKVKIYHWVEMGDLLKASPA